jgi:CRP-like cAMP-binding protein
VVALEAICIAKLPEAAFRNLVDASPAFAWALLQHLSVQMRRMTERVYEFSTLVVRERLIRELLRLSADAAEVEGGSSITPAPTHFDLAARISTHREAVSREMSALAKLQLIERQGRTLLLRDLKALRLLVRDPPAS